MAFRYGPAAMAILSAVSSSTLVHGNAASGFQRPVVSNADVDTQWHAPAKTQLNNLTVALHGHGVYGFIYNSSTTPDGEYGTYNWCNMPHVRRAEYMRPAPEYELQYVELMHRHHKRTPYASNAFPIESYHWDCDDEYLFLFGRPANGDRDEAAASYRQGFISSVNPFVPSGWIGSCTFPQITAGGLSDSWQHGADLYDVYHGLLKFLPAQSDDYRSAVRYRVTNNVITSQVAGMVVNGMWSTEAPFPLIIEADGVDSLEPQYSCPKADDLFNGIESTSNPDWRKHLDDSADLYNVLDNISGVPSNDSGFHSSFDHYYDNLSSRQCHDKPLPCKLVNGANSSSCVTQELADTVYRMGNWEYSQIYRDQPSSLPASAASLGVWIGEFTTHIREFMSGHRQIIYFHNVAHDGSVSRLLSILQIDEMVWPGMGSEVIFELYKHKGETTPLPTEAAIAPHCNHDNCLREMIENPKLAGAFCESSTTATKTLVGAATASWLSNCPDQRRRSSACSCLADPTSTKSAGAPTTSNGSTPPPADNSAYYLRVLFGGKVLKSSHPSLGIMDMVPVEIVLDYLDGLVGKEASLVKQACNA